MSLFRRRFITHPKFQIGYALAVVRGVFVALFLPACGFFTACIAIQQDPSLTYDQYRILNAGMNNLIISFLWSVIVLCTAAFFVGIYLSNKFAGPLRRMETWLAAQMSGGGDAFQARPGDDISVIAQILNRMLH